MVVSNPILSYGQQFVEGAVTKVWTKNVFPHGNPNRDVPTLEIKKNLCMPGLFLGTLRRKNSPKTTLPKFNIAPEKLPAQ